MRSDCIIEIPDGLDDGLAIAVAGAVEPGEAVAHDVEAEFVVGGAVLVDSGGGGVPQPGGRPVGGSGSEPVDDDGVVIEVGVAGPGSEVAGEPVAGVGELGGPVGAVGAGHLERGGLRLEVTDLAVELGGSGLERQDGVVAGLQVDGA